MKWRLSGRWREWRRRVWRSLGCSKHSPSLGSSQAGKQADQRVAELRLEGGLGTWGGGEVRQGASSLEAG